MNSLILEAATRIVTALILLFSIYMLFRGHNEPGGGFIGGLIAAIGFALLTLSQGVATARQALRIDPKIIAISGLALALASGCAAWAFGDGFFTAQWVFFGAEAGSKGIPFGTVILFDIGVYLLVVGSALTLVFGLEEAT